LHSRTAGELTSPEEPKMHQNSWWMGLRSPSCWGGGLRPSISKNPTSGLQVRSSGPCLAPAMLISFRHHCPGVHASGFIFAFFVMNTSVVWLGFRARIRAHAILLLCNIPEPLHCYDYSSMCLAFVSTVCVKKNPPLRFSDIISQTGWWQNFVIVGVN